MISWPLFKLGIKSVYKPLLIFMAVFLMYTSTIVSMFDPELGKALDEFSRTMPELMAMFGMTNSGTTLISFMSTYLYGFIMLVFPFVFTIIVANNLVVRHVDRGSMAYLLAASQTRVKVILTQIMVYFTAITSLILFGTVIGIAMSEWMFPGDLDIGTFIMLNIGVLCLHFAIGGFCFFSSCISNETRYSLFISAGFIVVSYLLQMLANMGDKLENLKYVTFFTLFDAGGIIAGEGSAYIMMGVLVLSGILLYIVALYVFNKRDLPI